MAAKYAQWQENEPHVRAIMAEVPEFRHHEIASHSGVSIWQAQMILQHWQTHDVVRPTRQHGHSRWYAIVDPEPVAARDAPETPTGSAEGNMWRAMRLLASFSPLDVAAHATAGGIEVDEAAAARYCQALLKCGYLTVSQMADPSLRRPARYRLTLNSGPDAPVIRRVTIVYDPNREQTHLLGGAPA